MWLKTAALVCLSLVSVQATVRATAKEHHGLCILRADVNVISLSFRVKLNSDAQGQLRALNNADFSQSPRNFTLETCNVNYDSAMGVYTVISEVDLDNANAPDRNSNLCGMTTKTISGETVYEWLFMHNILVNGFSMLDDKDRVYTVRCTQASSASNIVSTSTDVSAPNLIQQVTPASLTVNMYVDIKTSTGTYTQAQGTIAAGSTVRLRMEYNRGNSYVAARDVYGINGFLLEAGSTNAFTKDDYLINDNGCATRAGDNNYPATLPIVMAHGFRGAVSGTKYTLTSGDIMLWKYKDSDTVFFRSYYDICFEPNTDACKNLCQDQTGSSTLRKKRDTQTSDHGTVATYVKVTESYEVADDVTDEETTSESSFSTAVVIALGAVLGALLIMVIVVSVLTVAFLRKRRTNDSHRRFENMSVTSSVTSRK